MSVKRRRRPPAAMIAALAVAAVLAVLLVIRLIVGAVGLLRGGGASTVDPQFAQPAETVTRPPELMGEGDWTGDEGDPSANWDLGEQTPVDKTAEELSREAEAGL